MVDDFGKEMALEAAKAVAVEGYRDALQPAFKAAGAVFALPFQAIDAALSRPKLWVAEKQNNYERTCRILAEKMKDTPEALIVPPENYVAVPALQQIAYCFDSDDLREMYANLLANSMNSVVKDGVHPSFVEIIKQLSPDEAKILSYMGAHVIIPTISIRIPLGGGGYGKVLDDFTDVPEQIGCEKIDDIEYHFNNLIRLGLVTKHYSGLEFSDNERNRLRNHSKVKECYAKACQSVEQVKQFTRVDVSMGYFMLTSFGKDFCKICTDYQGSKKD